MSHLLHELMFTIKVFLICWLVTHLEPLQKKIDLILNKIENDYLYILIDVLTCFKCLSFWSILILTQNIWTAIFYSLIANLYVAFESK